MAVGVQLVTAARAERFLAMGKLGLAHQQVALVTGHQVFQR
jgi:23S rRNA pseudoU1915 N3-methylase RlmH